MCFCPLAAIACGNDENAHDIISATDWQNAFSAASGFGRYLWVKVTPIDTDSVSTAKSTKTEMFGKNSEDDRYMYYVETNGVATETWYYEIDGVLYEHDTDGRPQEISYDDYSATVGNGKFFPFLLDFAQNAFKKFSYSDFGGGKDGEPAYVEYSAKNVTMRVVNDAEPISGSGDMQVRLSQADKSLLSVSAVVDNAGTTYRYELSEFGTWDIDGFFDNPHVPDISEPDDEPEDE